MKKQTIATLNDPSKRIIVALDTSDPNKFKELVKLLGNKVGYFKVGLEALSAPGLGYERAVGIIKDAGGNVFLDVKLKDIDETLRKTTINLQRLGADMINVHLTGSESSIKMVVENAGDAIVLGVTVLTDISDDECQFIHSSASGPTVTRLARKGAGLGIDGIVCSPKDIQSFEVYEFAKDLLKITPGIRPMWAVAGGQKRILTPAQAIQAGADFLVIGRPITDPPTEIGTPIDAIIKIIDEIAEVTV